MPADDLIVEALRLIEESHGLNCAIAKVQSPTLHIFASKCGNCQAAIAVLRFCARQPMLARLVQDNWNRVTPTIEDCV